jgi:urea transport system ATP-binding protein
MRTIQPPDQHRPAGSIIYLEDVTVDYDGFKALNRLNFYMDYRELRVVIGPNGAGKTTLLDVISGRVKPAQGRLVFGHATDLLPLGIEEIAGLGIGRKFQTPAVFVNLTVWENVELSLRGARRGVFASLFGGDGGSEARDRVAAVLDAISLSAKSGWLAGTLAHGERQWLEIGMVMAQEPELLLVDEPVAGLTDEETVRTGELLEAIAANRSVLVIEHDMEFVRRIARRVTVLHQGSILCEGSVDQVQADPRVLEVYLGQRDRREIERQPVSDREGR